MKGIVVIPARGGSKGIPRKNVRLLGGKPLIAYSIENALNSAHNLKVVVSTDDEEIARISKAYGAEVVMRPKQLATDEVTLDPVIFYTVNQVERNEKASYDYVLTMQPTSPLLSVVTLDAAISYYLEHDFDTVLSGINQPHLSWTEKDGKIVPNYKERLNRQYLPKDLFETGAFFISKRSFVVQNSRFGSNVSVFEIPKKEAIDIDTPQDWWVAEKELNKKNILIRVEGYAEIGLGHIYRGLMLAYNLIDHNIKFVLSAKSDIGLKKIQSSHFAYEVMEEDKELVQLIADFDCDILINDILDTTEEYILMCKRTGVRVVNFEDLGEGAIVADAVINDLYEEKYESKNHFWGSDYYLIRDEFLLAEPTKFNPEVKEVLVIFGGTDPSNLTERVLTVVHELNEPTIHFTFVLGLGYPEKEKVEKYAADYNLNVDIIQDVKMMTEYMGNADVALSSQGRTMLELASMGVPTILLAQNTREQHHEFGYLKNGFINLGLGKEVENETIKQTILWLVRSPQIRKQMKQQMLSKDLKSGINRVKNIIFNQIVEA
ncbi:cytidylyltransferase domain-containing protein [Jeotgalibaca porci]|uniref:cytidylyltransferase domain-containing protein n=1 Tax=Jeotgalibaca porci TaxID=1868793 RepID=UPI003F901B0B